MSPACMTNGLENLGHDGMFQLDSSQKLTVPNSAGCVSNIPFIMMVWLVPCCMQGWQRHQLEGPGVWPHAQLDRQQQADRGGQQPQETLCQYPLGVRAGARSWAVLRLACGLKWTWRLIYACICLRTYACAGISQSGWLDKAWQRNACHDHAVFFHVRGASECSCLVWRFQLKSDNAMNIELG